MKAHDETVDCFFCLCAVIGIAILAGVIGYSLGEWL